MAETPSDDPAGRPEPITPAPRAPEPRKPRDDAPIVVEQAEKQPQAGSIEPAQTREQTRSPEPSPDVDKAPATDQRKPSVDRDDVPDAIRNRYYTDKVRFSEDKAYYENAKDPSPVFRDQGDKLVAKQTNPETIRDMLTIAEHRGWSSIAVKGDADFRREVWLEASTRGMDVQGYKPTERDKQELDKRLDGMNARSIEPSLARDPTATPPLTPAPQPAPPERPRSEPLDYDKGVTGKLLETGVAPYKNRAGAEQSPYVKLETAPGKTTELWGVGLPAALERSGAKVGDTLTVKRDGVEQVMKTVEIKDRKSGETSLQQREVPRNRWAVEAADKFRSADAKDIVKDPALRSAQSKLAVVEAVVKSNLKDPEAQKRVMDNAREKIAGKIERGDTFKETRVRDSRDEVVKAPETEKPKARQVANPDREQRDRTTPERTRGR